MIEEAIEVLKKGGIMLYPTDTIWGIGADATNENACQKVIELKNRTSDKSFIILVDSIRMLERYVPEFPEVCYELIDYSVKPLTIIYPCSKGLASNVLALDGSVGIRVVKDTLCCQLIRGLKRPIVSTSANFTNDPSPIDYANISEGIRNGVDFSFPSSKSGLNEPSQIIKIGLDNSVQVIRN